MPAGRPLIFETPEELQEKVDDYFKVCDEGEEVEELTKQGKIVKYHRKIPYTVEGLSLHLDCSSETVRGYGKKDEYFAIVSCAKMKIFNSWIKLGMTGQYNPKIVALCLAANSPGYRPQQEVSHTVETLEDKLRRIAAEREVKQISSPDVQDAEIV